MGHANHTREQRSKCHGVDLSTGADLTRFNEYTLASKALAKVLLDSIGAKNQVLLKTLHPTLKIYAFTPRQIVDAMFAKHGIPPNEDIIKLRSPLDLTLTSLSDLENHMANFLASQRLTRSGQGETPYEYFERYLVTVTGFPSVALAMMGYYARYPAISQQNLATLFPFLTDIKDHLAKTDPASPFSGAARGPAQTPARRPGKKHNKRDKKMGPKPTHQSSSTTRWGAVNLAESAHPPIDPRDAQLAALQAQVAAMMAAPAYGGNFGMPDGLPSSPYPGDPGNLHPSSRALLLATWMEQSP
jgi:hypothetical protein